MRCGDPGAQGNALRQDAALAGELAAMLDAEIDDGSMKEQPLKLRYLLVQGAGRIRNARRTAALVKAAGTQRADEEAEVRLAALQAIAVLAENVRAAHPGESIDTPEVERGAARSLATTTIRGSAERRR